MKSKPFSLFIMSVLVIVVILLIGFVYFNDKKIMALKEQSPMLFTETYPDTSPQYKDYSSDMFVFATGEYPPYVYTEDGKLTGLDYEILIATLSQMDVDYEIQLLSWSRGTYLLDTGQVFGVFPYPPTKTRLEKYHFTSNFFEQNERKSYIYTTSKEILDSLAHETDIASIKNYRLGGIYGYFYIEELNEEGISFDFSVSEDECLNKLIDGKVDLIILDELSGDFIIDQYTRSTDTEIYKTNVSINSIISGEYLMLNPQNSYTNEFIQRFNQAIIDLTNDGTIPSLLKKYDFPEIQH